MVKQENSEKIAEFLLSTGAVKINTKELFTFASGIKSPIYCDNRSLIAHVNERKMIVQAFANIVNVVGNINTIIGTATAGIPWASFLAYDLDIETGYVRSAKKNHGTSKLLEGADVATKNILLVEDLITTGGSVLKAANVLKNSGAQSVLVSSIFTYGFKKTYQAFEKEGVPVFSLTDLETLIQVGMFKGYLSESDKQILNEWKNNKED